MKQLSHFLGFIFVYLLYLPFKFLPYQVCLFYGRCISGFLYPLAFKHRKIALENLSHAFPDWTEKQKKDLLWKNFMYMGNLLAGSLYAPRINSRWMDKYLVYDEESLRIEKETNKEGVGVVLISGHLGTWEILVQFMGLRMKGGGIYKKIRNPLVDKLVKGLRENNGIVLVPVEDSGTVVKMLKSGYWIGFGADQNAGKAGIFVDFFNRKASTFQGPVLMAYLTGAKILYYSVVCGEKGQVLVRVKDLGFINKKLFPEKEKTIRHYTELWTKTLESEVRLFPDQYFWVHRRWRTKPGDFPGQT